MANIMMTSSNIFRVTATQKPVTRSFYVFFDLRLNERLSKESWGWWFETLSRPLWRHCNVLFRPQCVNVFSNWLRPWTSILSHRRQVMHAVHSARPIYRGLFSTTNSRETHIARPLGRGMGVFRDILVWTKFYHRIKRTVCDVVLYGRPTMMFPESIVLRWNGMSPKYPLYTNSTRSGDL